jgi:hypothetical protein
MIEPIEKYLKFNEFFMDNFKTINNEQYEYIWGGCILDKQKRIITKYVNKRGTHVADVYYRAAIFDGWNCLECWVENRFMGYISFDFTSFVTITKDSFYWLNGIVKSMEIVREQEAARLAKEQEKNEIIKNKEKEMNSHFVIIQGYDYHDAAKDFLDNWMKGGK